MIHVMKVNQRQSELLSVKDLQAYAVLQQVIPQDEPKEIQEPETDDQIAFKECAARGLTDDEKLYFRAKGFDVAD